MGAFVIYLLHLETPNGSVSHYCGSAQAHLFPKRLKAHQRATHNTKAIPGFNPAATVSIGMKWIAPTRDLEASIHELGQYAQFCAICTERRVSS